MKLAVDLHIHSCLSPCAEDDMTPNNIVNMAYLKGLDAIAVCDHNTARNLPAVAAAAKKRGLLLVPGIELCSREEVHLLAYFPTLEAAVRAGETFYASLPNTPNDPKLWGNQWVLSEDDERVDIEPRLLIQALTLPLDALVREVRTLGGVPVPAHINRGANGLISNLGMMPEGLHFTALEVYPNLPLPPDLQTGYLLTHASDAHRLQDILERTYYIEARERSVAAILETLAQLSQC